MIIKPFCKSNYSTIVQLIRLAYADNKSLWSSVLELEDILEYYTIDLITLDDQWNTIIGFCLYEKITHKYWEIKDLVIHPDYQGFGYGTTYLEDVFLPSCNGVVICNPPRFTKDNMRFLFKCGFRKSKTGYKYNV